MSQEGEEGDSLLVGRGGLYFPDLLCTVEVKHLIFIITSNFFSSELNIYGRRPKKPLKLFFISLDGNHFLLFFF